MKRIAIVSIAVLALAGCSSSLTNAQSSCSDIHPSDFSAMWDCVKGRAASGTAGMMDNHMGVRYLAFGDVLNEQYRAGQLSNAEARLLLSQELARGNAEFDAGKAQTARAISEAFRPPTRITCNTWGNTTTCY